MWEMVLLRDSILRTQLVASTVAFFASQRSGEDVGILQVAARVHDMIFDPVTFPAFLAQKAMRVADYRAAGIIFGMWAAEAMKRGNAVAGEMGCK
jgi:hypothetical protein